MNEIADQEGKGPEAVAEVHDNEAGAVANAGREPQDPQPEAKPDAAEKPDQAEKETLTCEICYDTVEVDCSPDRAISKAEDQ